MVLGKRKQQEQMFRQQQLMLDQMGPGDVLLAGAQQHLKSPIRERVTTTILDDDFCNAAISYVQRFDMGKREAADDFVRKAFIAANDLQHKDGLYTQVMATASAKNLLKDFFTLIDIDANVDEYEFEIDLGRAAMYGAIRMCELGRFKQGIAAVGLASMLMVFSAVTKSKSTVIYVAKWGENLENKCTFYVNEDQSISWTPDTSIPALFEDDYVFMALNELERALGKTLSFPDHASMLTAFTEEMRDTPGVTVSSVEGSLFHWEPELPQH